MSPIMPTDKEFEDFFREQLGGLEEAPPADGWNKIREDLKPWYVRYRKLTALALLFLLSVATVTVMQLAGKFNGNEAGEVLNAASELNASQTAMENQERNAALPAENTAAPSTATAEIHSVMQQNTISET